MIRRILDIIALALAAGVILGLAALEARAAERIVGQAGSARGDMVRLFDAPGPCPAALRTAIYTYPPQENKAPVVGCWYEWRGLVRIAFEDADAMTIPFTQFKPPAES